MAKSVAANVPPVDALLGDLPTAHRALPIGRRIAGQGCHGTKVDALSSSAGHRTRVRFIYFPTVDDNDHRAAYHQHLMVAEVLLGRVLAARAAGLRPMAPSLDYAAEDLPMKEARARVAQRSHALPTLDQAWLIDRRSTPLERRPLNQVECRVLVVALDGIWQSSAGASHVERANRRIALRVAAVLGSLLDEYVASPFKSAALSEAFNEHHLAHLRQTIESSRQAESASGTLLAGPKAWFAAKTARMRAEHQIGLAMSPAASTTMRLSGRPVVAVVGGRLHTFVDGRRPGARLVPAVPVYATFG
jgi:hypothetical protein